MIGFGLGYGKVEAACRQLADEVDVELEEALTEADSLPLDLTSVMTDGLKDVEEVVDQSCRVQTCPYTSLYTCLHTCANTCVNMPAHTFICTSVCISMQHVYKYVLH